MGFLFFTPPHHTMTNLFLLPKMTASILPDPPTSPSLRVATAFAQLVELYEELGLSPAQAASAAQADALQYNRIAFRQRGALDGTYLVIDDQLVA